MAKAKRPPLDKVMTPKGIAKFPALTKPDTKFNADGEFKIGVILSEEAAAPIIKKLKAAAAKALEEARAELTEKFNTEKGEKKAKAKKALEELKEGDLPCKAVYDEDGNETGDVCLNFKMKASRKNEEGETIQMFPKLFDAKGTSFPKGTDIWGGSEVKVAGSLNPFYIPGTNTCGVGLRLAAVQVLKLNSGGGGDASSYGFGKEDGYEAPKSEGEQAGFTNEGDDSEDTTDF